MQVLTFEVHNTLYLDIRYIWHCKKGDTKYVVNIQKILYNYNLLKNLKDITSEPLLNCIIYTRKAMYTTHMCSLHCKHSS